MKGKLISLQMFLHMLVIIASLAIIVSLSYEVFMCPHDVFLTSFVRFQFWICLFFQFDFFLGLYLSVHKKKYLFTHFFFFFISIPYLSLITYFQIDLSNEIYYCLRFVPIIRGGYALVMVVNWFSKSIMANLFISYLLSLIIVIYFSSLLFYVVEKPINVLVQSYSDALWWAFMDATTVGSNVYAVTVVGKLLSVLLAAFGMMMFPIFTVYITDKMQKIVNRGKKE